MACERCWWSSLRMVGWSDRGVRNASQCHISIFVLTFYALVSHTAHLRGDARPERRHLRESRCPFPPPQACRPRATLTCNQELQNVVDRAPPPLILQTITQDHSLVAGHTNLSPHPSFARVARNSSTDLPVTLRRTPCPPGTPPPSGTPPTATATLTAGLSLPLAPHLSPELTLATAASRRVGYQTRWVGVCGMSHHVNIALLRQAQPHVPAARHGRWRFLRRPVLSDCCETSLDETGLKGQTPDTVGLDCQWPGGLSWA